MSDVRADGTGVLESTGEQEPGLAYLSARLMDLRERVTAAVNAQRQSDPAPDDPFRGLYLSNAMVDWLVQRQDPLAPDPVPRTALTRAEETADQFELAGHDIRLRRLAKDFGLLDVDVDLLLVALLPELDTTVEQLMGYLNDDVTRRRASVGLALQLCGLARSSGRARARLAAGSPLLQMGLVLVEDQERPFLGRSVRVPDRVVSYLLGVDIPDELVADLLREAPPPADLGGTARLAQAITAGARLVCLRDRSGGPGRTLAAEALAAAGLAALPIDLPRLAATTDLRGVLQTVVREALLLRAGIIAEIPTQVDAGIGVAVRALSGARAPVLFVTQSWWDPDWSPVAPLQLDVPAFGAEQREALWQTQIDHAEESALAAAAPFLLSPEAVVRAAAAARSQAGYGGTAVTADHVRQGARLQNAAGLERLARRTSPAVSWDDLVLPEVLLGQLREIALRARYREQVLGQWRMRPGGGRGHGVSALFAGDSGTGKTMSAEVIAGDLGLDLYTVNLATVVDKYVGETEKNLERIFSEAAHINGVLFFDEADAVFGKRSDVKDAHDRYANIESAYLLQRMESFDGLVILATNLRSNLDDAFTRRLDLLLDFPAPNHDQRRAIWERCLGGGVPLELDLDLDFCARTFDVTGGAIRAAAVTAAYLAAGEGRRLGMAHLIGAMQREYRKMGRLLLDNQFQEYRQDQPAGHTVAVGSMRGHGNR